MNTPIPTDQKSAFLLGVFTALNFDDKVTENEVKLFVELLKKRPDLLEAELLALYREKFRPILKRDYVSRAECSDIKDLVFGALGIAAAADSERMDAIPFDQVDSIDFAGLAFVVTGQFKIGRGFVETYIEDMGGEVKGSCSRLVSYLIVGSVPDPVWKYGNYGTKVRGAVDLRKAGHDLRIVSEDAFTALLKK
jgi:NAD-dependent DNA ligase